MLEHLYLISIWRPPRKPWRARHIPKNRANGVVSSPGFGIKEKISWNIWYADQLVNKDMPREKPYIVFPPIPKPFFLFTFFFVTLKGSLREKTVHVEIWSPATRYTLYVQSISHPFMNRPNGRPLKTSWISEGRTFNLSSISFLYMYIYIYIYPGSPKAVLQTAVYGKTVFWEFRAKTVIQGLRT